MLGLRGAEALGPKLIIRVIIFELTELNLYGHGSRVVNVWNSLPESVIFMSLPVFKRTLTTVDLRKFLKCFWLYMFKGNRWCFLLGALLSGSPSHRTVCSYILQTALSFLSK